MEKPSPGHYPYVNSYVKIPSRALSILILFLTAFTAGCADPTLTPTATVLATETAAPTPTPTPVPLGHADHPFTIGLADLPSDPAIQAAIDQLVQFLNDNAAAAVAIKVLPGDQELYAALEDGEIHAAWLQPLTYIRAHENNLAEVALLSNHFGTYFYGTQFLANVESGFTSYFDPTTNKGTADLATALPQLDGKRPCWVEPGSISGYILPLGLLEQAEIIVQPGVISQTYPAVVRSLYIKGVCDFGVTFSISGDPRTSSAVVTDLPDAVERVIVIWQTDPVIPNLNFSIAPSVDAPIRNSVAAALQDFVKTDEGKRVLTQTLGEYEIQDLKIVDDSIYDPIRAAVRFSATDLSRWIGR